MSAFLQGVGSTANLGGAATAALAFTTQNTAAGSLLVAVVNVFPQSKTLTSVTDNQGSGNSWTILLGQSVPGGNYDTYFCYALNTTGGSKPTVTFHFNASTTNVYAALGEFSGVKALRTSDVGNTGSSASPTSSSITPTAGDLLIGYFGGAGNVSGTPVAGLTYTYAESGSASSGSYNNGFEYKLNAAGGSTTANFVIANEGWSAGIAAFVPGSSGGGGGNSSWLTVNLNNSLRGLRH